MITTQQPSTKLAADPCGQFLHLLMELYLPSAVCSEKSEVCFAIHRIGRMAGSNLLSTVSFGEIFHRSEEVIEDHHLVIKLDVTGH